MQRLYILGIILLSIAAACKAQDSISRPIRSTYRLEAGAGKVLDTYLSPLHYTGESLALSGEWSKALGSLRCWDMKFDASVGALLMRNPARNAREYEIDVDFAWSIRRGWTPVAAMTAGVGTGTELFAGCVYLPRNGNNPAAAKASLGLFLSAFASYWLNIGKLPVILSDEVRLPSVSMLFSQQYGESYYEIYLGNRSGLIHCGWWGNNFSIDNHFTATLRFSRGDLTVGYRFKVRTSHVNNLDWQRTTNAVTIGWTPALRRLCTDRAEIIESWY